eukprot:TRINITY_DN619_c0_g1_i1.p1 TRINITY_DN619_c0_g1~~TRINITY_DN619_c0_g1_i1.p1  ORF type:complete len:296 (+),score=11.85 TRINITY_DN619_c0_g1_i1:376-1263(+)
MPWLWSRDARVEQKQPSQPSDENVVVGYPVGSFPGNHDKGVTHTFSASAYEEQSLQSSSRLFTASAYEERHGPPPATWRSDSAQSTDERSRLFHYGTFGNRGVWRRDEERGKGCCSFMRRKLLIVVAAFLVAFALIGWFWPRVIFTVDIVSISLFTVEPSLPIKLNFGVKLTGEVRNPNYVAYQYDRFTMSILYGGGKIADMATITGGMIPARDSAPVTLALSAAKVNVAEKGKALWEEFRTGSLSMQLIYHVDGGVMLGFIRVPVWLKVRCNTEVKVPSLATSHECALVWWWPF